MGLSRKKKGKVTPEMNVTPLVDVVLVLLIIFMVITPMLQKGVDVTLPEAANSKDQPDNQKTVTVAVRRDGMLYLKGIPMSGGEQELKAKLPSEIEELPDTDKVVYLKADERLKYTEVMKVMDLCREAGAEEVALIVEKKVQG